MKFDTTITFDNSSQRATYIKHVFPEITGDVQAIGDQQLRVVLTKTEDIIKFLGRSLGMAVISKVVRGRKK